MNIPNAPPPTRCKVDDLGVLGKSVERLSRKYKRVKRHAKGRLIAAETAAMGSRHRQVALIDAVSRKLRHAIDMESMYAADNASGAISPGALHRADASPSFVDDSFWSRS